MEDPSIPLSGKEYSQDFLIDQKVTSNQNQTIGQMLGGMIIYHLAINIYSDPAEPPANQVSIVEIAANPNGTEIS
jgi:hypothetical protein